MASLLLAVLVMAAAPIREARADELPKDTNTIESLTVEQARKLVEEFPGVTVEVTSKGGFYKLEKCLPLNGITKLTPDVAQALAGYSRGPPDSHRPDHARRRGGQGAGAVQGRIAKSLR